MAKVLLIGSGGREHAIAWTLAKSPSVSQIFVSPGNGGTAVAAKVTNVKLDVSAQSAFEQVISFVRENQVSCVVVGPEQPLVDGIADALKAVGIPCFGPSKKAAVIEASKAFSKDFMARHKIPTARYSTFTRHEEALKYLQSVDFPVVIKASGLAAGKGVLLPETKEEARNALRSIMLDRAFGDAGSEVVIEERLSGPEVSVLAFTDGYTVVMMPPAQDHKRVGDGDQGPNTGGMGAYAPAPIMTQSLLAEAKRRVLQPAVDGLRKEGRPYVGVLYAGLMLDPVRGIQTLEFNCRFGDPETQAILPLLDADLYSILLACVEGRLDSVDVRWKYGQAAVTVVLASQGYPGDYTKGLEIAGLDAITDPDVAVFHAGTELRADKLVSSGGRVLAVSALTTGLRSAVDKAYEAVRLVQLEGSFYRKDIAHRAFADAAEAEQAGVTYKAAGVDIEAGDNLVNAIKPLCKATARTGSDCDLGGFGGLFDLKAAGFRDPILVSGTDGVGTKLLVAQAIGKHDTIGIDLVAMSVNDIVVQGAEPLFFLDYYATGKLDTVVARDVISGIAKGCSDAGCALVGGETAEMPGMYPGGKYDLAGFAVGAVERDQVLPMPCTVGDVVLGLASSGIHSNGYSLVRHLLEKESVSYDSSAPFDGSRNFGELLLTPTKIYVKSCLQAIRHGGVVALAHITGGGLTENLPRVLNSPIAAEVDLLSWPLPPVFKWLSQAGNMDVHELLRTFNCGIGMVVIVRKDLASPLKSLFASYGETVYTLGSIVARKDKDVPVVFKNAFA
eukprot:TRINITY_DN7730_c0_g1_i2.p1 TRINITY_DN7730_c0_g1~~TRINITY_DN7730_c0_g1_i2.p1  ORF type:complete len:813 (-),score=339.61 TRINITY_DN7730_c0_g1_i2:274-2628(-)